MPGAPSSFLLPVNVQRLVGREGIDVVSGLGGFGRQRFQTKKLLEGCQVDALPQQRGSLITSNKELLGAPGIATRSKDATRGSWPYYYVGTRGY